MVLQFYFDILTCNFERIFDAVAAVTPSLCRKVVRHLCQKFNAKSLSCLTPSDINWYQLVDVGVSFCWTIYGNYCYFFIYIKLLYCAGALLILHMSILWDQA